VRTLTVLTVLLAVVGHAWSAEPQYNCESPATTMDFNVCGDREAQRATQEMNRYLEASRKQLGDDSRALKALDESQRAWQSYKDSQCSAIGAKWRGGTISGPKEVGCDIALTRARTRELWAEWLTYADRTPPILPEPSTTCDIWASLSWTACRHQENRK
jgi:uncharacterized protein YecT (DUF1311 family)